MGFNVENDPSRRAVSNQLEPIEEGGHEMEGVEQSDSNSVI